MKTLDELKQYYSNASKEDLLIEAYEYYTNSHDMTNLVFQLQQEKEELINFLKERYLLLTTKTPKPKEEISNYLREINGRLKELDFIIQYLTESKLKESDKDVSKGNV